MNISTFSEVFFNKMLSSGVSEHFSMSGDGNGIFSTDKCKYTILFFGISFAKRRKQNSPTCILLHSVLDVHNAWVCKNIDKNRFFHPSVVKAGVKCEN